MRFTVRQFLKAINQPLAVRLGVERSAVATTGQQQSATAPPHQKFQAPVEPRRPPRDRLSAIVKPPVQTCPTPGGRLGSKGSRRAASPKALLIPPFQITRAELYEDIIRPRTSSPILKITSDDKQAMTAAAGRAYFFWGGRGGGGDTCCVIYLVCSWQRQKIQNMCFVLRILL